VLRSALDSIVRLDEKSPAMPRALLDVAEEFQAALETGGQRYGGARTPEADAYRHVVGSRNATLKAGVVPALAGGVGHELKNVVEAIRGNLDQAGLPKGAGLKSVAKNSLVDLANNLRGIMSAVRNPQELGEEEMMELLSAADLPPQG
jgi:hypothetical protein